jgi:hypothetical protein
MPDEVLEDGHQFTVKLLPCSENELCRELKLTRIEDRPRTPERRIRRGSNTVLKVSRHGANEVWRAIYSEHFINVCSIEQIKDFGEQLKPQVLLDLEETRQA